jgi:P4 family phage/plasmid primase-like protien
MTNSNRKSKASTPEIVAMLRGRGFALCRPDKGEKKPTYKRWPTRSLEPDDFGEDDLIGILGGSLSDGNRPGRALVPIDLDDAEAIRLADEFLPTTGMEEGREGKPRDHRYYLVPLETIPSWAESNAAQAAPAARKAKGHPGPYLKHFDHIDTENRLIDFIGTGGQIVCPSPGNQREWVGGKPGEPAVVAFLELWEAVCRLAVACGGKDETPTAKKPASEHEPSRNGEAPQPGKIKTDKLLLRRIIAYLDTVESAVSGQGGHDGTYWPARVVCLGFDRGEEEGFRILWQHYNPRCQPPWTEAELRHKCHDADTLPFNKPRGWLLNEEGDPHLTDLGNAQRVVVRHGGDMRFCFDWKQFLVWDGARWRPDDVGEAVRRVKETQRSLYRLTAEQLAALAGDGDGDDEDDERKAKAAKLARLLKHALVWEDERAIRRSLELVKSEPGIPIRPADMDRDPWLLNVANGTIDLRTAQLRPHRREDMLTKIAAVAYDPAATCPLWDRCLETWMDGNPDLVDYLRRVVGYSLTADVSEQALFFLHGGGANGKSTFLGIVREMMGDYGCQAVSELLLSKNTEAHPTERADLFGKRFVATIESEEGKRMAEALMKQLTGGDAIRARRMRQDFFEIAPTWKIFLAANHKPAIRGTDFAVWRRIRLIPFAVTIRDADKDKDLQTKLRGEIPGILAWAVRGCREWQLHGLADPEEVVQATAAYRREQDVLAGFISDCCVILPEARIKASLLLQAYQTWSGDKNISRQTFQNRLNERGFRSQRGTGGHYFYHGIGLPADTDE